MRFHPSHLQTKKIDTIRFCALVGLFLTKLNHHFNVPIDTNVFCSFQSDTKCGGTALLIYNVHLLSIIGFVSLCDTMND